MPAKIMFLQADAVN